MAIARGLGNKHNKLTNYLGHLHTQRKITEKGKRKRHGNGHVYDDDVRSPWAALIGYYI